MLNHKARLAVHSAKDLPVALDERLCIAAVMPRRWRADAFISKTAATLDALPAAAQVGTASLRRAAQLKALHPQLCVKLVRGNLDSRLTKLDAGGYDALILAQAGVARLGHENRIQMLLDPRHFVPPAGQGRLRLWPVAMTRKPVRCWRGWMIPKAVSCSKASGMSWRP